MIPNEWTQPDLTGEGTPGVEPEPAELSLEGRLLLAESKAEMLEKEIDHVRESTYAIVRHITDKPKPPPTVKESYKRFREGGYIPPQRTCKPCGSRNPCNCPEPPPDRSWVTTEFIKESPKRVPPNDPEYDKPHDDRHFGWFVFGLAVSVVSLIASFCVLMAYRDTQSWPLAFSLVMWFLASISGIIGFTEEVSNRW